MSWLKLHDSFGNDPKLRRLSRRLGVCEAQADGHASNLWAWCLLHAKDGDLSTKDPEDIAVAAKWEGDPDVLISAMVACRLLDADPLSIHNWMERQGSWKAAVRQQKYRASKPVTPPLHNGRTQRGEERRREEKRSKRDDRLPDKRLPLTPDLLEQYAPKRVTTRSPVFERFWVMVGLHEVHTKVGGPGKGVKGKAHDKWKEQKLEHKADVVVTAVLNYYQDCLVSNTWPKQVERFLNPAVWRDWIDRQPRTDVNAVDPEFQAVVEAMSSGIKHVCVDGQVVTIDEGQNGGQPSTDNSVGRTDAGVSAGDSEASVQKVRGQRGPTRLESTAGNFRSGDEDRDIDSTTGWAHAASLTQRGSTDD